MANENLNPLETKILDHWSLKSSKIISASAKTMSDAISASQRSAMTRGGIVVKEILDSFINHQMRIEKELSEMTRDLLLEWNCSPSEKIKKIIQEPFQKIFDPDSIYKNFLERISRDMRERIGDQYKVYFSGRVNAVNSTLRDLWLTLESRIPIKQEVFISSSESEFDFERQRLKFVIENDQILGRFYKVFIFEKDGTPNQDPPPDVYLSAVRNCDVFIGIFGKELREAVKAEFEEGKNKNRLVFFDKRQKPDSELELFRDQIRIEVSYYEFDSFDALQSQLLDRLNDHLKKS